MTNVCAEPVVEPQGDVASDLDVLPLIFADRYVLGVVQQDVGGLESGVREQPGRDEITFTLCRLVLELGHAAELAVGRRALHHPAQLAVLNDMALHEDGHHIGIEADGEQHRCQSHGRFADRSWYFGHRQGVQIDDSVKCVGMLAVHPVAQRPQVISEVDFAGGLDAREHAGHGAPG